jgi:HAD superfamily hydrolase (TIGR01509 family)
MRVQAVLLDLGDTLIFQAREPDYPKLRARMAAQVQPLLDGWAPGNRVEKDRLLKELFEAVETAQPEWRARGVEVDAPYIARGALWAYGVEVTPEQAEAFWRATAVDLADWGWQLYPDTLDTLRRLRSLAIPVAIVSNGRYPSDVRQPLMAAMGLTDDLIQACVFSPDVGRPKPDPAPFRRALDLLGVAPHEAAFVGDDLAADIVGAKAIGLTTVWKLNGRHEAPPAPEADYTIHDLWELFTLDLLPGATAAALPQESLMPHEDGNAGRY